MRSAFVLASHPEHAGLAHALRVSGWVRLGSESTRQTLEMPALERYSASAGSRAMLSLEECAALVAPMRARLTALGLLAEDAVAMQCSLFRKTAECNWKVASHQDLSVPVAARVAHPELGGWSMKEDGWYVQPPVELLERCLAVRLHLDDCPSHAGALRVVSGSHAHGRLKPDEIAGLRSLGKEIAVEAKAGDILIMRPLLVHASSKAVAPNGRRVLHFVFAPPDPGYGLRWRIAL